MKKKKKQRPSAAVGLTKTQFDTIKEEFYSCDHQYLGWNFTMITRWIEETYQCKVVWPDNLEYRSTGKFIILEPIGEANENFTLLAMKFL